MTSPRTSPALRLRRNLLAVTSLGIVGLLAGFLSGCAASASGSVASTSAHSFAEVSGNWQISSASATHAALSSLGGALTVSGSTITGTLHALAGTCLASSGSAPFAVSGSISADNTVTLSSTSAVGGAFHLTGTLSADQRSLLNPTFAITGGHCASGAAHSALSPQDASTITIAQQYQPVSGTYTGSFSDADGTVMAVSATLTQSSSPDANGYYHLTGNATFANNPCLNAPIVTDSVINGASITATYTDPNTGNSIVGSGTFDNTATTLTVTNWTLTGSSSCADTGTGSISK